MPHRRLRRGTYLIPTLFTVGNLFCGFSSIIFASRGAFSTAAVLIVLAGILDGLDGRIARLTGTTSEFGLEFDSLADIVSFGVAPAFLAYHWALRPLGRVGWLFAFLFVICAAMRLARFNIQTHAASKRYFAGLPSPPAAGVVATLAFAFPAPPAEPWVAALVGVAVVAVALLMVSRFRYRSFKDVDLKRRFSFLVVLVPAAILVAILVHPRSSLLLCALVYAGSGPTAYLWSIATHRGAAREARQDYDTAGEIADGTPGR